MDLYACSKIGELDSLAKANGIDIPRLRGYRLMKDELTIGDKELKSLIKEETTTVVKDLCEAEPFWSSNPKYYTSNTWTDRLKKYYVNGETNEIRWDRIHGWKRKVLKFELKKNKRRILKQFEMFNRYAGVENVLYIHSRMGGYNWKYYDEKTELMKQPWFLGRVDDYFDSTYCDFYALLSPESLEEYYQNKESED